MRQNLGAGCHLSMRVDVPKPSCVISNPRCGPLLIPLTFTYGEPFRALIGLKDMEQVLPGDGLGLGARRGSEPGSPELPDAFPCLFLRSLAFFLQRQAACSCLVISHHIRALRHCTASPPLLAVPFPPASSFLSPTSLCLDMSLWSGSRSPLLSWITLSGTRPFSQYCPLYLTSVPLGKLLSPSP